MQQELSVPLPLKQAHDHPFPQLRLPFLRQELRRHHWPVTARAFQAPGVQSVLSAVRQGLPEYGGQGKTQTHGEIVHAVLLLQVPGEIPRLEDPEAAHGNGARPEQAHRPLCRLQYHLQQRQRVLPALQAEALQGLRGLQALRDEVHMSVAVQTTLVHARQLHRVISFK